MSTGVRFTFAFCQPRGHPGNKSSRRWLHVISSRRRQIPIRRSTYNGAETIQLETKHTMESTSSPLQLSSHSFASQFFCNLLCVLLYLLAPQIYQYSFNSPVHPPNIVAHISQQWQWCTFWNRKRTILAHFGPFGANLCTFWWTFTGQMWHLVSNMSYSKCKRLKYFKTK